MAVTQDYQIELDGVLLGVGTSYDLVGIQGFGIPPVRANDIERANGHGSYSSQRELLQGRTLNLEVEAIGGASLDTVMKTLRAKCVPQDGVRTVDFRLGAEGFGDQVYRLYGYVRRVTSNIGDNINYGIQKLYIQIEAVDPRIYDADLSSSLVTTGTILNNAGSTDAPLSIDFTGPFTEVAIANNTTGETLTIYTTATLGQTLIVNTLEETVLLNGVTKRADVAHASSKFIKLVPGNNSLTFTAVGGDGNTTCTVYWRHTYV